MSCTVLEAETVGFGGSGRNGGQVIPGLKHDPAELVDMFGEARGLALAHFAGEAPGRTFGLIERLGLSCAAQRSGWLQPAVDPATLAAVSRRAKAWADIAGVDVGILDQGQIQAATGSDFYVGGWLDPRGGQLQPLSYARELARVTLSQGVTIHENSPASHLRRENGLWHVSVNGHTVRAPVVIVCTNGYTGGLVKGLEQALIPASSIICSTAPLSPPLRARIMPSGLPMSDARRLLNYMRYDAEGRFMIGARGSFGLHEPDRYFRWLRAAAERIFPLLKEARWEDSWGGRFALTADHLPHIHNPEPGLFMAVGCNGRGVAMMSQIGRLLADLATQATPLAGSPIPVTPVAPLPFHAFRRPALEAVTLWYRARDHFNLG